MRKPRGFTLIELAVAVAIIGVLAAAAYGYARYARGNATLGSATFEFVQKVRGLRFRALSENTDYVFVFANSASANALDCGWVNTSGCARWWILKGPRPGFALASFDPASPTAFADYDDSGIMPRGVHLTDTVAGFAAPAPFASATLADPVLTGTCTGGRSCFAIRYTSTGKVTPIYWDPTNAPARVGYAFAFTAHASVDVQDARVVLVSFPAGIVKVFTY